MSAPDYEIIQVQQQVQKVPQVPVGVKLANYFQQSTKGEFVQSAYTKLNEIPGEGLRVIREIPFWKKHPWIFWVIHILGVVLIGAGIVFMILFIVYSTQNYYNYNLSQAWKLQFLTCNATLTSLL